MAETKKFLDFTGLQKYDELLKAKVAADIKVVKDDLDTRKVKDTADSETIKWTKETGVYSASVKGVVLDNADYTDVKTKATQSAAAWTKFLDGSNVAYPDGITPALKDLATTASVTKAVSGGDATTLASAKSYTDGKVDGKFDAVGSATKALEDAKAYTDTEIGKVNTTTSGLRTDVNALKTTVGDSNSGLVKDVAANATAITALQGLHADNGAGGKKNVATEVSEGVNAKVGDIKLNNVAVTVKEYVDAGDAKALADAKSYTDTEIGKVNTAAETLGDRVTTLETSVGKSTDAANADGSVYARIAKNAADIATLVGSDAGKSARTIATEEVAKVVADAPESYDTLKEIADWIANDTTGAASMANDISNLKTTVGDASNGLVKKVNDNATAISGNANAIDALQKLHVSGKTVAQEVTDGIAGIKEASVISDDGTDVKVTVKTAAGSVSDVIVDASVLAGKVGKNTAAIATLNGNAQTEGSVDYKIAQAVSNIEASIDTISEADINALFSK